MWRRIPIELPYGMERYKSSTHYAFTYKAIEYIVTSHLSLAVLDFMKKFRCNDEHFFAVLHYNYNITRLPGSEWAMDPKKSVANQFELRYKEMFPFRHEAFCISVFEQINECADISNSLALRNDTTRVEMSAQFQRIFL